MKLLFYLETKLYTSITPCALVEKAPPPTKTAEFKIKNRYMFFYFINNDNVTYRKQNTERHKLNATFTLNGFSDQERNLKFVKTDFQVLL